VLHVELTVIIKKSTYIRHFFLRVIVALFLILLMRSQLKLPLH